MINLYNGYGKVCYINVAKGISQKSCKLLWGNGFILDSPLPRGKELIRKWHDEIDLESFFYQAEDYCSTYGWALILPNKSKDGTMSLETAEPWQVKQVAWINRTIAGTDVYSKVSYTDNAPIMRTKYTDKEIIRQFGTLNEKTFTISGNQYEISKKFDLPTKEIHNLGFIPIVYVPNLPYKDPFNTSNPFALPDTAIINNLQELLDHTFHYLHREIKNNRTRVFANVSEQETKLRAMQSNPVLNNVPGVKNLLELLEGDLIINNNQNYPNQGPSVVPLVASPQFASYTALINDIIKWMYEFSGLSWNSDVTTQKSETEVVLMSSRDAETTRIKRTLRTRLYKQLFYMMGRLEGLTHAEASEFIFEINENISIDRFKQLELSERKIAAGFSSREQEIAEIEGITIDEALEKIKEIDKSYQRDMNRVMPLEYQEDSNKELDIEGA